MPDLLYDTGRLRAGAAHSAVAALGATSAVTTLGAPLGPSPFGTVSGADALHGALVAARDHHLSAITRSRDALDAAAMAATTAAALGERAAERTAALAGRDERAAAISAAMR